MLTFPVDKSDFAAPNGVTYAWDEVDEKWRVKAFRSIDDFIVEIGDTPPDDAKVGDLWFDTTEDSLTLFLYTGDEWVSAAPPVSLDGVNATIDAALLVQSDILNEQGIQNNQINALETQLQLLAQSQAVGRWTYRRNITTSVRPPATATFYGTDKNGPVDITLTDWANVQLLMVDKTDKDGTVFTFSDFQEGDKLEILATDGSSGCFGTVTNNPNIESYGNLVLAVERSNGGPVEEGEYMLNVYRPGSNGGTVDLDVLDGRYIQNSGDNIITTAWRLKTSSKSFISITTNEMKLYNIADPSGHEDGWVANKGYVDKKADDKLPLAGGTLTGPLEIQSDLGITGNINSEGHFFTKTGSLRIDKADGSKQFQIYPNGGANFGCTLYSYNNGFFKVRIAESDDQSPFKEFIACTVGEHTVGNSTHPVGTQINWVKTPTANHHAVNKEYVDQMAGGPPVPAKFAWKFKGETSDSRRDNLSAGEFIGPQIGSGSSSYSSFYYLHLKPDNSSYQIYQRTYDEELIFNTPDGAPVLSVWYVGGSTEGDNLAGKIVHMCSQRVKKYRIAKSGSDGGPYIQIECHSGSQYSNHFHSSSLAPDRTYYVTLAGIF